MPKYLFSVDYTWREPNGERREGRTVVTHYSRLEAEAQFQRQNPHVSVVLNGATKEQLALQGEPKEAA